MQFNGIGLGEKADLLLSGSFVFWKGEFMGNIKYDVIVVGAGGTGTYFLKEISRYLFSDMDVMKTIGHLYILDGDVVEEKNLSRQCFMKEDIGRNKAAVMAEVLNAAYSPVKCWTVYPHYLIKKEQLSDLISDQNVPVIIGCVDNHAARFVCEDFFNTQSSCIYFDSANEYDTGELVCAYKASGKIISPCRSEYFPAIKDEDNRSVTELSCEELNQSAPQHIFTNMTAGLLLCSAFCNLMNGKTLPGVTYFNSMSLYTEYVPYSPIQRAGEQHV